MKIKNKPKITQEEKTVLSPWEDLGSPATHSVQLWVSWRPKGKVTCWMAEFEKEAARSLGRNRCLGGRGVHLQPRYSKTHRRTSHFF